MLYLDPDMEDIFCFPQIVTCLPFDQNLIHAVLGIWIFQRAILQLPFVSRKWQLEGFVPRGWENQLSKLENRPTLLGMFIFYCILANCPLAPKSPKISTRPRLRSPLMTRSCNVRAGLLPQTLTRLCNIKKFPASSGFQLQYASVFSKKINQSNALLSRANSASIQDFWCQFPAPGVALATFLSGKSPHPPTAPEYTWVT